MEVKNEVRVRNEGPLNLVSLDEVYNTLKKLDVPETAELTFYQPSKPTDSGFTVLARWEVTL